VLADVRFRAERTVTVEGMVGKADETDRGDERGGVDVGAGSLERVVCTRSWRVCILPINPRIWLRDFDVFAGGAAMLRRDGIDVWRRAPAGLAREGPREWRGGRMLDRRVAADRTLGVIGRKSAFGTGEGGEV
jgi:hypothetical protein